MNNQMQNPHIGDYGAQAKETIGNGINLGAALEVIRRFFEDAPALQQNICGLTNTPEYVAAKLTIERLTAAQ
jgi:hypothetical protein